MIDINDYKVIYRGKIRKISKTWWKILIFVIIGVIFINNSFKYYKYYQNRGEVQEKLVVFYALIDDVDKITKNNEILIDKDKFAYKITSIGKDNIYMNGNYYKEVKLSIDEMTKQESTIIDFRIVIEKYSLGKYVFETVWR